MLETIHGNYHSMADSENHVDGRRFFVSVASETRNAHKEWISFFKRLGHSEVDVQGDADYFLVFCPVKSRIKTDIDEALEKIPDGKPVILVVMHHTFNPNTIIMESRLQITEETRPDVRLTVDSLFYEGRLLNSNINDVARNQIQKCLRVPASEPSWYSRLRDYVWDNKKLIGGLIVIIVMITSVSKRDEMLFFFLDVWNNNKVIGGLIAITVVVIVITLVSKRDKILFFFPDVRNKKKKPSWYILLWDYVWDNKKVIGGLIVIIVVGTVIILIVTI